MEISLSVIISAIAMIVAVISLIDKYYGKSGRMSERVRALEERKTDPEMLARIVALETKTGPFWRVLEEHMVDLLKQPIHLKMDYLLDRYKTEKDTMPLEDMRELKTELLSALEQSKLAHYDRKAEGRTFGYIVMLGILESRISQKELALDDPGQRGNECSRHTTT